MRLIEKYELIVDLAKKKLNDTYVDRATFSNKNKFKAKAAVLFLLSPSNNNEVKGPHLILNRRSSTISQPGDLCCPGGKTSPKLDFLIAKILMLPGAPFNKWSHQQSLKCKDRKNDLSPFLFTALRESFEEIKLNPLRLNLLGALPAQFFSLTNSVIYPFVCYVPKQKKFYLNSEVDKIVRVPLSALFVKKNYFTYKIKKFANAVSSGNNKLREFPCFVHYQNGRKEILWGVTYSITTSFLKKVFNYSSPSNIMPILKGTLGRNYYPN